ncbi:MAG: peptide-methionine (S)-S-oxide reductase MsrA [Gammaproteobacteria bacterium]|nr:peptide-methionine (S)-S-oxide reductase MsrA [Gammaproteobacteria bacterium]
MHGHTLTAPFPEQMQLAMFGLGCFWGAEKRFWQELGVFSTAVGYAAGHTKNPTYHEVCSGATAHNEVVQVVFDPEQLSYQRLLELFWTGHNPTQGDRQGNDVGSQYRSGIYCFNADQQALAEASKQRYQDALSSQGLAEITTEIIPAPLFYYAESYHQQYLAKNPQGYCGLGGVWRRFSAVIPFNTSDSFREKKIGTTGGF